MTDTDTIIVVGVTRKDEYDNLWVTPQGGGDEVKIAAKRAKLHPLFEQGKAVMCHWETYMDKPYISNAKLVEGELPPQPDESLAGAEAKGTEPKIVKTDMAKAVSDRDAQIWRAVCLKELGECIRSGDVDKTKPAGKLLRQAYYLILYEGLDINLGEVKDSENPPSQT